MVRKIIALFFAAVMIALCAIPAAAEDTTSVETSAPDPDGFLSVRNFYSAFGVYDEVDAAYEFDHIYISNRATDNNFLWQTGGGPSAPRYRYGLVGTYSDFQHSDNTVNFKKNYTYHISTSFRLKSTDLKGQPSYGSVASWVDDLFITPSITVSDKTNISTDDFLSVLGMHNWVKGAAKVTLNTTTQDEDAFVRVFDDFTVDIVLRLNDLFEWENYCGVVPLIRTYAAEASDELNASMNATTWFEPTTISCTAYYDPTGEIVDDEVNEIVEGQKDAVVFGQDRELEYTQSQGTDKQQAAIATANGVFDLSAYARALGTFASAFAYQGTDFHFTLPSSGDVPFIGHLWDSQEIPMKQYIDYLPMKFLYIIRFFAWLGLLLSFVHGVRTLVDDINGGEN